MKFTGCFKEKLASTLKPSLLCVVMLAPTMVLAESPAVVHDQQTATSTEAIQAVKKSSSTEEKASTETVATIKTRASASQLKVNRLSDHIENHYRISESKAQRIVRAAIRNAKKYNLEPEMILAIIAVESTFRERAVSHQGARGLMQVLPRAHRKKIREIGGTRQLFNAAKNIQIGSRILAQYLKLSSGNMRRALLRYNGSLHHRRSPYANKVLRVYRKMQRATIEG